ncbi:MalY Bifunctional PLP-dependent enzyme with beta-cystathionase and maltose regulon repressor activities [Spirosomataceae bacterium]|jgi:cystathionine beta-lyase
MVEQQYKSIMDFDKIIDRKNTNSYKWDKYPEGVLPLWVADMDFEVAEPIKDALSKIVEHGVIGYSRTPDELVEVVVKRLKDRHKWDIQKEWIVWLPGLVPGLHTAARCISDDYFSVMTSSPVYRPFLEASEMGNRRLQDIPFIWRNDRWEMDFEEMKKSLNPSTRLYMLCNPHNPNGRVFSKEELSQLADFCVENDLILCSDEIHCDLILDESKEHISIASLNKEIEVRSMTLLAPSKTFNIAGLGCSLAIIPEKVLRDKFEKIKYGMMPMLSAFAMDAALAAYKNSEVWRLELLNYLRSNQAYLLKEINAIEGLKMEPLEATYLAWISYEGTGINDFVSHLESHGVGVQDASIFGGKGYFRLNFATQKSNLEEAIKRIRKSLNQ